MPLAPDDRVVLLDGRVLYQEPPDRIEAAIALRSIEEIVERLEDSDVDPTLRQWGIVVVDPASSPR